MLVPPESYVSVYESIKEDFYHSQEKKVLIFVATDSCDSVCATKTLQVLNRHLGHSHEPCLPQAHPRLTADSW